MKVMYFRNKMGRLKRKKKDLDKMRISHKRRKIKVRKWNESKLTDNVLG